MTTYLVKFWKEMGGRTADLSRDNLLWMLDALAWHGTGNVKVAERDRRRWTVKMALPGRVVKRLKENGNLTYDVLTVDADTGLDCHYFFYIS